MALCPQDGACQVAAMRVRVAMLRRTGGNRLQPGLVGRHRSLPGIRAGGAPSGGSMVASTKEAEAVQSQRVSHLSSLRGRR